MNIKNNKITLTTDTPEQKKLVISQILSKVKQIAPLSQSALLLFRIADDAKHSAADVTKVVETDPILTAAVLRTVNSTSYGVQDKINTVSRAINYLGDRMVLAIAIGVCGPRIYSNHLPAYSSSQDDQQGIWQHSLCTAIAAREIATLTKKANPGVCFTQGILHDIGKSVISEFLHQSAGFEKMIELFNTSNPQQIQFFDFVEGERDLLGTDHAEIGYALAKHWNLPDPTAEVIRYHHNPMLVVDPEVRILTTIVHLADMIAMMAGQNSGHDSMRYKISANFKDIVPISRRDIETIVLKVTLEFEQIKNSLYSQQPSAGE